MPPHSPVIAHGLGKIVPRLESAIAQAENRTVVVACSGGPDSVALAGMVALVRHRLRLSLVLSHVDHGLRPESAAEAVMVRELAQRLGAAFEVTRVALSPGAGLAARARDARLGAVFEHACRHDAGSIALGHTATDQAETVLMHLSRGAGLEGLAGMDAMVVDPRAVIWVRPLLDLSREQTRAIASAFQYGFVDDPTNANLAHPRVAVRERVLPVLRQFWPGVEAAIGGIADHARQAEDALTWIVQAEVKRRKTADGWSVEGLATTPRAIRTRFLRMVCVAGGVDASSLSRRAIDDIDRALLRDDRAKRSWDLRPRRCVVLGRGQICVECRPADEHPGV